MQAESYSDHLKRLQEEQEKALTETDERIYQWQTFKSDYEALKERLKTLPDKLSHDVMVPFGKLAFMPGQLVHTNEVLVLLGDNWFVERSAKQAAEIVGRRMKTVDEQLEDLLKQRKLLEPRREFTSGLESMTKGEGGVMDIREEYDEEKEREWRVTHKKNVLRHRQRLKEEKGSKEETETGSNQSVLTDEELWARLDRLEQTELKGREMQKIGTAEGEDSSHPLDLPWSDRTVEPETSERLQGASSRSRNELDSDDDYYESDNDDEKAESVMGKGKVIHFHHTKNEKPRLRAASMTSSDSENEKETIDSPADIYTKFSSCFGPRSILKTKSEPKKQKRKKKSERKVAFEADDSCQIKTEANQDSTENKTEPQQTAFSGTVVEKIVADTSVNMSSVTASVLKDTNEPSSTVEPETKPVSRFKAQRLGKNIR